MCGITGIVHKEHKFDLSKMELAIDTLKHRGPDGNGKFISRDGKVGLGHTRLSILDLSKNGAQPMTRFDRMHITFNGEIYNYIELRGNLEKQGYSFESGTDTEVLLAMYCEHGNDCLEFLDGMFSFVIFDEQRKRLFGARDRFGEKPFFYAYTDNQLVFSSEIKGIFPYGVQKKWRQKALTNYLDFGIEIDEEDSSLTFFENIKQLKAGHCFDLDLENWSLNINQYWTLRNIQINNSITFDEAKAKVRSLFNEGLRRRLRSDVQIGTSLSGGIDSSIVALSIVNESDFEEELNTYSARFKNFKKDEGKFMEKVIHASSNIKPHMVWLNEDSLLNHLEQLNYAQDEPYGSGSILAQFMVMKEARNTGTTVLLDGQGADEYFAGYFNYYKRYLRQLEFHDTSTYAGELMAYNELSDLPYKPYKKTESLRMKLGRIKSTIFGTHPVSKSYFRERLLLDCEGGHLQSLLRYGDRNSMANSVESRLPFLYHKLVEFVFTLPDEFLLNLGWTKYVLREAFCDLIPADIAWRKDKIGYETPNEKWLVSFEEKISHAEKNLWLNLDLENKNMNKWRVFNASMFLNEIKL